MVNNYTNINKTHN